MSSSDWVTVRLSRLPVATFLEWSVQHDALLRELVWMELDPDEGLRSLPSRLSALLELVRPYLAPFSSMVVPEVEEALARSGGVGAVPPGLTVDAVVEAPPGVAEPAMRLDRLLDEVDDAARAGRLITPPAAEHVAALRRWYLSEFARQARGQPPRPFERTGRPARVAPDGKRVTR